MNKILFEKDKNGRLVITRNSRNKFKKKRSCDDSRLLEFEKVSNKKKKIQSAYRGEEKAKGVILDNRSIDNGGNDKGIDGVAITDKEWNSYSNKFKISSALERLVFKEILSPKHKQAIMTKDLPAYEDIEELINTDEDGLSHLFKHVCTPVEERTKYLGIRPVFSKFKSLKCLSSVLKFFSPKPGGHYERWKKNDKSRTLKHVLTFKGRSPGIVYELSKKNRIIDNQCNRIKFIFAKKEDGSVYVKTLYPEHLKK